MSIKYVKGNLITLAKEGNFDLISHGCNCFCCMGAGIAKDIKREFPGAYQADCKTSNGKRSKLGTCSFAEWNNIIIVNAYTQHHWKGSGVKVKYGAIRSCLKWIKKTYPGKRIGLPRIGCGLAGGDWSKVEAIIEEVLGDEDVTVVNFVPTSP
jgi:O-acetyl-ADP-ribose deacetylase (regulator of RNase III)